MVSKERLTEVVVELFRRAVIQPPVDVVRALQDAYRNETSEIARTQLKAILDNIKLARKKEVPVCQDTGIPLFYVTVGSNISVDVNDIHEAVVEGVAKATKTIPLRPNVVDPVSRKNSGNNIADGMPHIDFTFLPEKDYVEITVLPKGAGSENMSALAMLKPSEGVKGVKKFVLETVARASGNPCPPTIIGVGLGGSSDLALALAKKALLRPIGTKNRDRTLAALEVELKEKINQLGVGPMGLGGRATCLAVQVEKAGCHTASLPVGINMQCWTGRRAAARVFKNKVEWLK